MVSDSTLINGSVLVHENLILMALWRVSLCICALTRAFASQIHKAWMLGAQWLSGRVLDSRPRGRGFEPHRRHCVVSLSKTHIS